MDMQEVSLKLERYDDIFSDFDIRPYSRRALSVDFLDEIKRASRDKEVGGMEVMLYMPEKDRSESHEAVIKGRLADHFKKHHGMLVKEKWGVVKLGIWMVLLGALSSVAASLIVFENPAQSIVLSLLLVLLQPVGLFMLWQGLELIIFRSRDMNAELDFYLKMSEARDHIRFKSY